jgi:hypothetical protein
VAAVPIVSQTKLKKNKKKWAPPLSKILIGVAEKRALRSKGKEMIEGG